MNEAPCWLALPEEVLVLVFRCLSPEDLTCRAARVCRSWRRVAQDESLWAAAQLRYTRDSQDEFTQVLQFAPVLNSLDYSGYTCELPARVASSILHGVQKVKELHLQTTNKVETDVIERILLHFKNHLEKLTLFVNSNLVTCNPDQGIDPEKTSQNLQFLSVIREMSQLRTLVLKGAWRCHSKHADVGEGCPQLESLDISGLSTDFFDEHECPFFVMLLRNKRNSLRSLSLSGCYIHPSILCEVAQVYNLRSITVSLATLHVIERLELLESLHIRGQGRGDGLTVMTDVTAFLYGCPRFAALRELVLEDVSDHQNKIAPAVAAACTNLEKLTVMQGTVLDSRGFSELLRGLRSLRRLEVRGSFTLGLRHVQAAPRLLPHLRLLDVRGCFRGAGLPPRLATRMTREAPNLRVLCDPFVRYEKQPRVLVATDMSSTDESEDE